MAKSYRPNESMALNFQIATVQNFHWWAMTADFGKKDRIKCPSCDNGYLTVVRRTQHPARGKYESQRLGCDTCDYFEMRNVDADGKQPK